MDGEDFSNDFPGLLILSTTLRYILTSMIPKLWGKYRKIRPPIEINLLCNGFIHLDSILPGICFECLVHIALPGGNSQ